jgi:ABC-type phosphate transport system permease subunit
MKQTTRIRWGEFTVQAFIRLCGFSAIGFVSLIFIFLLREGMPAFFQVPQAACFCTRWYRPLTSLAPCAAAGSALVTIVAMVIAFRWVWPRRVFVREVAPNWAREVLKPMIEVLPVFRRWCWLFRHDPAGAGGTRALGRAHASGLYRRRGAGLHGAAQQHQRAEDALDNVPRSYRSASLAMGATHWQTICGWWCRGPAPACSWPHAGMGRAIGETWRCSWSPAMRRACPGG